MNQAKTIKRLTRHKRIRARLSGTAARPRLSLFKSNRAIYAQVIDDDKGVTLVAGSDPKALGEAAKKLGVKKIVFDRGGFIYTGRVKAFADTLREAGLEF